MDILGPLADSLGQMAKVFLVSPLFWVMLVVVIALAVLRLPVVKGWFGEWIVNLQARLFLPKAEYHMVANVTVPDDLGGTTQIDHVVVSRYGVFVVETKNMKGWIFGGEHDGAWTQKIHGGHSQRFQNPLRQNYKHTQTLIDRLGLPAAKVFSVIAFVGDCRLKTRDKLPPSVCQNAGWVHYVRQHRQTVFSEQEIDVILQAIEAARLAPGLRTHRDHVRYVRELKGGVQSPAPSDTQASGTGPAPATSQGGQAPGRGADAETPNPALAEGDPCPRCGSRLVARVAGKGARAGQRFLGCSAFPTCRFIAK